MSPHFHRVRGLAATLLLSLAVGCGGVATAPERDDGVEETRQDDGPRDEGVDLTGPDTAAQLAEFWDGVGGQDRFPPSYVDTVETLLEVEDLVMAGDFAEADAELDRIFGAYPLSDPVWWSGVGQDGTNVGTPVAYYGLRMLREIVDVAQGDPVAESSPITMAVVLPECAAGFQPTTRDRTESREVLLELDPRLREDDYRIIRQSLRLFERYLWAITGGALHLELRFEEIEWCARVGFSETDPAFAGLQNANQEVARVDDDVARQVDMWWILYPSNRPRDAIFDETAFITGGMGLQGRAPLFIIDDTWLTEKPPHLGQGDMTDVERRVYLPQWLQHEFFHHLYRTWPELGLEDTGHQWFDRGTWPADFVGEWEPDYYAESLRKRLYSVTEPTIEEALRVVVDLSDLDPQDFLGSYERQPVENDWHRVDIVLERERDLVWTNAAGRSWGLTWQDSVLGSAVDSPYGEQEIGVQRAEGGRIVSLFFNGEAYTRIAE